MNKYSVSSLIGEGSFGRVYKATRKHDNHVVAIKVISKRGRSSRELKNLRRECDIQGKLKHSNIIEMFESFETKNDLVVVTECAQMDLHRYLARNGTLSEERAQMLICHLVSALYYLHSHRILHRDLKPQNVLLNSELHAKLCDFGLARNMTMGTHVLTSIKGTPLYMAPELLSEQPYNHQADLWSLGCISYETMAGQPPFSTTSILHLVKLIKHEEVKWPSFLSSDCCSFLQGLLEKDPSMRISWTQILCHPFVENKLLIVGNKANDSPYINPQHREATTKPTTNLHNIMSDMSALNMKNSMQSTIDNNMTSSRDSMNAIAPSDFENLETDTEDNCNRVVVPFAESSYTGGTHAQSKTQLAQMMDAAGQNAMINSQTCFVSGNCNMILNHLNDNFPTLTTDDNPTKKTTTNNQNNSNSSLVVKKSTRSKDLEKRKLSQNLDNFSLRLGHVIEVDEQRKTADMSQQQKKDKPETKSTPTNSTQIHEDKLNSVENSPPCLLPGWDSCDESQSPPIENDEWLAFLNRSMQEVLDGEMDSVKQHNLVSIIVAPLRNAKALPKVLQSVAQLLSLPFVLCDHAGVLETIKSVYVDVKLVPNLMYASKLLLAHKMPNDSVTSMTSLQAAARQVRTVAELCAEELRTTSTLYELICLLVHLKQQFLTQFCDAVAILAADDLLINLLNHDFKNGHALRTTICILGLCCCVLRELPENAELVEKIIFSENLNLLALLQHEDNLLRLRMCMLLRLLARFSLRSLQNVWNVELKRALDDLANSANMEVQEEAKGLVEELQQFAVFCA